MANPATRFADPAVVGWAGRRCLALTTYRRDGRPVVTPVWFVTTAGTVCLWTDSASGKVKRLTNDARCAVAPCTTSGRVTGAASCGQARVLGEDDIGVQVQALLRAKYPIQKRALDLYSRLRRGRHGAAPASVYVEITLVD